MAWQIGKVFIAAIVISGSSWLAGRHPKLAGFLLALPLASMIALAFNRMEYRDTSASVEFAKSIFVAVPVSLLFFVPFLAANRLRWEFWPLYGAGLFLTVVGYGVHTLILR